LKKHPVRTAAVSIALILGMILVILAYDTLLPMQEHSRWPSTMYSYPQKGWYLFDPEILLPALENGDLSAFAPTDKSFNAVSSTPPFASVRWSQSDYLKIAGALGKLAWDDPMDLDIWGLYSVTMRGFCDEPFGLEAVQLVYFKPSGLKYVTRIIQIEPTYGWAGWGSGTSYRQPVIRKWVGFDPVAGVSADRTLQIIKKDANESWLIGDYCRVTLNAERSAPRIWEVWVDVAPDVDRFIGEIDLFTGEAKFFLMRK
jgi:hypothetical protein